MAGYFQQVEDEVGFSTFRRVNNFHDYLTFQHQLPELPYSHRLLLHHPERIASPFDLNRHIHVGFRKNNEYSFFWGGSIIQIVVFRGT